MQDTLSYLGLNEGEIQTFLALLERGGEATATLLSRELGAPRPTVYGHLDTLIERGLVKKGLGERGAVFYAESPTVVAELFDQRIQRIKDAQRTFKESAKQKTFTPTAEPKFAVYEGHNVAENIFWDILRSREKTIYWFWPVSEMLKAVPDDVFKEFHEERIKRNMFLQVIWPEKYVVDTAEYPVLGSESTKKSLREIRVLSGAMDQITGYGMYGTRVGFLSSTRENFGFVIDSQELSQTMKSQFDYFWKLAKPYGAK